MSTGLPRVEDERFSIYFPFVWSGEVAEDGRGGPAISDPLEFRLLEDDEDSDDLDHVHRRTFNLRDVLLDEASGTQCPLDGKYDEWGVAWSRATAAALRALADEIEAPGLSPHYATREDNLDSTGKRL